MYISYIVVFRYFGDTEDESDGIGHIRRDDTGYGSNNSAKSVVYLHSPAGT